MNRLHILLGIILVHASLVYAQEENGIALSTDKIMMAIEASNPAEVCHFIIPGYFIRADQKARYLAKAQEVSNQTYIELTSYGLSDLTKIVSGLVKCSAAALFGIMGYKYYRGNVKLGCLVPDTKTLTYTKSDESGNKLESIKVTNNDGVVGTWQLDLLKQVEVTYADFKWQDYHKPESRCLLGVIVIAALYSAKKGLSDFWSVVKRTERVKKHKDALAVEALIQRLPECNDGTCPALIVDRSVDHGEQSI